jgi:ketosteroid isomerase-like protein
MTTKQISSDYYLNVKMKVVYFAIIIGLIILVTSCTGTTSKLQLDPIQVEKELRAFETIHREAIDSKDIDGILKCYATDLITISPDEPILYGKDWIRTLVTDLYKTYDFHEDFKLIDIQIIEEHVVASYSFSQQMTPLTGGEPTVQTGKGMCILNQSETGNWQFVWNAYNYNSIQSHEEK